MKKYVLISLFIWTQVCFAQNLATQMQSLNCQGKYLFNSAGSFSIENQNYLAVLLDNETEFYIEKALFNHESNLVISLAEKNGWNSLILEAIAEDNTKLVFEPTYGLLESDKVIVKVNGEKADTVKCRIVWRRWE